MGNWLRWVKKCGTHERDGDYQPGEKPVLERGRAEQKPARHKALTVFRWQGGSSLPPVIRRKWSW